MKKYRITMLSGREHEVEINLPLENLVLNIEHPKPWPINKDVAINCKFIESIEVIK